MPVEPDEVLLPDDDDVLLEPDEVLLSDDDDESLSDDDESLSENLFLPVSGLSTSGDSLNKDFTDRDGSSSGKLTDAATKPFSGLLLYL